MNKSTLERTVPEASEVELPLLARLADERGASTAEYAIVVTAAVALASVLVVVAQSEPVRQIIEELLLSAFGG